KDYDSATRAFAEVIKKYPTSARAPDSMLKLGQALLASGRQKEGCTALAALPAKYPKAAKSLLAQGAEARRAAACRVAARERSREDPGRAPRRGRALAWRR